MGREGEFVQSLYILPRSQLHTDTVDDHILLHGFASWMVSRGGGLAGVRMRC